MFRVGQKVVCVDDSPSPWGDVPLPKRGVIYTVTEISWGGETAPHLGDDGPGLRVAEIKLTWNDWFKTERFRPVVERKTDISIFTRMLDGVREMAN